MTRPLPISENNTSHKIIEIIAGLAVVWSFVIIIWNYGSLPDIIPTHFDLNGKPDGYGNRTFLWFIPVISLILITGLKILNKFPQKFNYLVKITDENARHQYSIAQSMIRTLNLSISLLFLFLTYLTIDSAKGNYFEYSFMIFIIFLLSIFGMIFLYLYKSPKKTI